MNSITISCRKSKNKYFSVLFQTLVSLLRQLYAAQRLRGPSLMPVFFIVLANSFCSHNSLKVHDFFVIIIFIFYCVKTQFSCCVIFVCILIILKSGLYYPVFSYLFQKLCEQNSDKAKWPISTNTNQLLQSKPITFSLADYHHLSITHSKFSAHKS